MNRATTAVFFLVLGAGIASVAWWTFAGKPSRPSEPPAPTRSEQLDDAIETIGRRIDALGPELRLSPAGVEKTPLQPDPVLAEIQTRLAAIEAALAKPGSRRDDAGLARPKPPEPKAKDQDLIVELHAKGNLEPGINIKRYWGWLPQEIHQSLGKPDATNFDPKAGQQDWFYWLPEGHGSLQVRFEAGFVIGVWP